MARYSKENQVIGRRLHAERIKQNRTLASVAELVGVSYQQIQKYERGQDTLPVPMLIRIAAALEIPTYFICGDDNPVDHINRVTITDTEELQKRAIDFADKLVIMITSEPRNVAWLALWYSLPTLWCSGSNLNTITDAVDGWRKFSLGIEDDIRKAYKESFRFN